MFGTNQIELAHLNWQTPNIIDDLARVSSLCDRVGLNLTIWFTTDLWDNQTAMNLMMSSMKRLDGLFLPAGDGGPQLAPAAFLALVKSIGDFGKRFHPTLEMWVSTQSYSAANFSSLMGLLKDPQVRLSQHPSLSLFVMLISYSFLFLFLSPLFFLSFFLAFTVPSLVVPALGPDLLDWHRGRPPHASDHARLAGCGAPAIPREGLPGPDP